MKPRVRTAVAIVIGALVTGKRVNAIFDPVSKREIRFGGSVRPDFVNVFDGELGAHLSGSGRAGCFSLFHYGESHEVTFEIDGTHFDGFDHGTSSRFHGDVRGDSVTVFDEGERRAFQYSISERKFSAT